MLQVVWFKRDLRISDHAPLMQAARSGPVLPLYIAEPGYWALPDTSARQWEFVAESLGELQSALTHLGQPLVIRRGDVAALLSKLHAQHGIAALWSHEETGNAWTYQRDKNVARFCREAGIAWSELPQFGVVRGLKNRDRWAGKFAQFMDQPLAVAPQRLEAVAGVPAGHIPTAHELGLAPAPCPGRQLGGRSRAFALLDSFFAGRGRHYQRAMSSPLSGATSCTRLSAHLAAGDLSMREAVQFALAKRMELTAQEAEARAVPLRAVDAFIARLHWHCHFIQKLEREPEIEQRAVHPAFEAARRMTPNDDPVLLAWAEGRTGFPFVDACMRSLMATGWINFRMRAMLMAFASYQLNLDWRATGLRLAQLFTDYEPGIHWPQVQMQAGQTGINTPRMYNPVKQSVDQDKDGVFMRRWLPELAALPVAYLHEPWRMDALEEATTGIRLGHTYPHRIVDHEVAAREARARMTVVRASAGFRTDANGVFQKHGSRKRTLQKDNPRRDKALAAKRAENTAGQFSFEL